MYNNYYLEEGAKALEVCKKGGLVDKATMEQVYSYICHYEYPCKKLKPVKTEQSIVHTELGDINVFNPFYDIAQWTDKVEEHYNNEINRGKREIEDKKRILNNCIQSLANIDKEIEERKQLAYKSYLENCKHIEQSIQCEKDNRLSRISELQKEIAYLENC